MPNDKGFKADGSWLAWGLLLGLALGAAAALFYAPRSGVDFRQWLSQRAEQAAGDAKAKIESVAPADTIAQSMAEGKEAARRRREGVMP